jgi:hypothetical protein
VAQRPPCLVLLAVADIFEMFVFPVFRFPTAWSRQPSRAIPRRNLQFMDVIGDLHFGGKRKVAVFAGRAQCNSNLTSSARAVGT